MMLLIITNVLYALGYPLSKIALDNSQPLFLLSVRMLLGGTLFVFYQLVIKKKKITFSRTLLSQIILSGLLSYYLSNILEIKGLERISATRAAVLDNLAPILSAALEFFIFKDTFTVIEWVGILIVTFGSIGIMPVCATASPAGANIGFTSGDFMIFASNVAGILSWIFLRKATSHEEYDPFVANTVGMFVGGFVALGHSLCTESWHPIPTANVPSLMLNTVITLVIYNVLIDNSYARLAARHTATTMTVAGFTVPTFVACFDWLFFRDAIPSDFWVSTLLVVIGLICCDKRTSCALRAFFERLPFRKTSTSSGSP